MAPRARSRTLRKMAFRLLGLSWLEMRKINSRLPLARLSLGNAMTAAGRNCRTSRPTPMRRPRHGCSELEPAGPLPRKQPTSGVLGSCCARNSPMERGWCAPARSHFNRIKKAATPRRKDQWISATGRVRLPGALASALPDQAPVNIAIGNEESASVAFSSSSNENTPVIIRRRPVLCRRLGFRPANPIWAENRDLHPRSKTDEGRSRLRRG